MTDKQQEMIEYTSQDIVAFLIEDYHMIMEDALDFFYMSKTFDKLSDVETGLYLQGSAYVYELLKRERTDQLVEEKCS